MKEKNWPYILMMTELTQEYLKSILHYNPETGIFTRKVDMGHGKCKAGERAGAILFDKRMNSKYYSISINYKNYRAARLAWFYITGEWPPQTIDHKNVDSLDDRWENLRLATPSQNQANRKKYKDNGLPKGVRFRKNAYEAEISGKYLGRYKTPEEAHEVWKRAAIERFGEFVRFD